MIVYLVCETVDLGYHVVVGYTDQARAQAEVDRLNSEAFANCVRDLIGIGYTPEEAQASAKHRSYYELDSVEVDE